MAERAIASCERKPVTVFGTITCSNNGMSRPSTRFAPVTSSLSLPAIPKACVPRCKALSKSYALPRKATSSSNRPLPVRASRRRNGASVPTGSSPTDSPITPTFLTRVLVWHPFYRRLVYLSLRLQIFSPSSTFPLPPLTQRLQRQRQRLQLCQRPWSPRPSSCRSPSSLPSSCGPSLCREPPATSRPSPGLLMCATRLSLSLTAVSPCYSLRGPGRPCSRV